MIIRREQMNALREASILAFESEMLTHLQEYAPRLCQLRGDDVIRDVIRNGTSMAAQYGFTVRAPVRLFLEMQFSFGCSFDSDPQLRCFRPPLEDQTSDQLNRAEALFQTSTDYFNAVAGPHDSYAVKALRRTLDFALPLTTSSPVSPEELLGEMERVYPQKFAYVGRDAVAQVIVEADEAAGRHGALTPTAVPVIAVLMFAFGHGVLTDLLYPWVGAAIADTSYSVEDRILRLADKARAYGRAIVNEFETR